jgi:DNA invertase Pin-like site-specific DNA recombinase
MPECAVGYLRVSTSEQAREGISLAAQEDRIRSYCAAREVPVIGVCADEGLSGRRAANRPGLERALAEVCRKKGLLVAYSLSRLARSTKDAICIAERLEKCGAQLVLLAESVDTTTAAGRMFYTVLAALAAFESDQISERTSMALCYKRANGEKWTSTAPFGYLFVDGKVEEAQEEQAVIRRIRQLRDQGHSYRQVSEILKSDGVTNRAGQPLPHQRIREIAISQRSVRNP